MRSSFAVALVLITTPALAQESAPAPAASSVAAAPQEKPICRRTPVTGSNFSKRECHSRAEWKAIDASAGASIERALQNRRNGN